MIEVANSIDLLALAIASLSAAVIYFGYNRNGH